MIQSIFLKLKANSIDFMYLMYLVNDLRTGQLGTHKYKVDYLITELKCLGVTAKVLTARMFVSKKKWCESSYPLEPSISKHYVNY